MQHRVADEIGGVLAFIGAMWAVFLVGLVAPIEINRWGITPRTLSGLIGIPLAPLLHASFRHLTGNTVPLFVLLVLLAGSRARSWEIVIEVILVGGGLLWLLGRPATHIGASGLIFGLVTFLILSGILERRVMALAISLLVGLLYGGTLLGGIFPQFGSAVSWEGHLCGALAGSGIAWLHARDATRRAPATI